MKFKRSQQVKTAAQIKQMRRAGLVVAQIHHALREAAQPGVRTRELDDVSREVISRAGAKSNFLGYGGFPATVCTSVNQEIVHGIPSKYALRSGDLVSFDCGAYVVDDAGTQWHGDAAFTMIVGGETAGTHRDQQLNALTEESMWAAVASLAKAKHLNAVGNAVAGVVERWAEETGWEAGIIEEFVGHGIGRSMHEPPEVLNYPVRALGAALRPGMVLAVEPMLVGTTDIETETLDDEWTVVTASGARAAHWEHTVAILPAGVWVLTAADGGAAGLAPYGLVPASLG